MKNRTHLFSHLTSPQYKYIETVNSASMVVIYCNSEARPLRRLSVVFCANFLLTEVGAAPGLYLVPRLYNGG